MNPAEAVYCWFDGANLRALAAPGAVGPERLPHEFVFPAGRHCQTYDDLLQGCLDDWDGARALLTEGAFRQYLTGAGRLDLARAADEALREHADADLALDAFLHRLPATAAPKPELELQPRKLLLGTMAVGESRAAALGVQNIGRGVLHGTLTVVEGGSWLRLAGADGVTLPLRTVREQTVLFTIDVRGLPAPMKCAAHLNIITNGGIVEVPVRLDVLPQPFPHAPYQGAASPRDLAVRLRNLPKPAVALFADGVIQRWFETNGWGYPVIGPTAPGLAAVQQFFEGLGLARAPRIELDEPEAFFSCAKGGIVSGRAGLSTADRKWLHAQAAAAAPWLRVTTPHVSGPQHAGIDFEVDTARLEEGRTHETTLNIEANAGQKLALRVRVEVRGRPRATARARATYLPPPPVVGPSPLAVPLPEEKPSWARTLVLGALAGLLLRLLLAGPGDLYARVLAAPFDAPPRWAEAPAGPEFIRHFIAASWWLGAGLGLLLTLRRGRFTDWPSGLIAGAAAGVALSATAACCLPLLDSLPRLLWARVPALPPWPATLAWVALAAASWTIFGALAGVLLRCGRALTA